ncbi:hypothetical protein SADUNF_Sadunf18G0118700 [Salix dunnii]|uniref:Uncharacterized protein n=1 Tax=Salix dunnii TaxID=1413687 RepID=A0A835J3X8_9ROSI|nr:hypothetical protein SADUNF_Sadunf18G0118700 [Salix dunnii]
MARFQVIAVAILVMFMLMSIGMSTALPKPIQGRKLFQYNSPIPCYATNGPVTIPPVCIPRRETNAVADSSAKQGL